MKTIFEYEDIENDDVRIRVDTTELTIFVTATIYNFNREVVSRNKKIFYTKCKNKDKFFTILKNNIGNMGTDTRKTYLEWVSNLEKR